MDRDDKPIFISVIIIAYRRKEFLLNALKSVINQTLDKKYYEIIVIKNFKDGIIDNFIENKTIKNILSINESLGGKLSEALNYASGNVISLLEDDDLFTEDKLEHVYNLFKNNNKLDFYHNAHFVNSIGNISKSYWYLISDKKNYIKFFKKFYRKGGGFNLSSMSIRKEFMLTFINSVSNITYGVDNIILYFILDKMVMFMMDNKKLTIYRFQTSYSRNLESYSDFAQANAQVTNLYLKSISQLSMLMKSSESIKLINGETTVLKLRLCIAEDRKYDNLIKNLRTILKYSWLGITSKIMLISLYTLSRMNYSLTIKLQYYYQFHLLNIMGN